MNKALVAVLTGAAVIAGAASGAVAAGERSRGEGGAGFWGWGGGEGRGHHGRGGLSLRRLDANKDGTISRDEFLAPRKEAFQSLDADKSGAVAASELRAPFDERVAFSAKRFMKRLDANGDGKVSKDEFDAGPKKRFAEHDLNSDGVLSRDERPGRGKHRGGWGWGGWGGGKADGRGEGKGRHEMTLSAFLERSAAKFKEMDTNGDGAIDATEHSVRAAAHGEQRVKRVLHRQDSNKDGQVTEAEFTAKADERFAVLDLNSDGKITGDDLSPDQRRRWDAEKDAREKK